VPVAWLALAHPAPAVYLSALFVAELLLFISTGPINVVIVNVVPIAMRATAVAISIFAIHMLGDLWSPWTIGKIADKTGLEQAVLALPLAIALAGVIWTLTAALGPSGANGRR
jgi:hypothetical protein